MERRRRRAGVEPQAPAVRSRRRARIGRPAGRTVPYAELHCHSNFSFLDGASHPEELATEAARLGLEALALTDHDGFYGVVRFAEAARAVGMPTVFGAEITLTPGHRPRDQQVVKDEDETLTQVATGRVPDSHAPDPHGEHLLLLADGPDRVRPAGPHAQPRPPGGGEGGAAVHAGRRRPQHRRGRVGAHRVPQGRRARGAGGRRSGGGPARAAAADRGVRARPGARRAVGPRRPARLGPQRRPRRAGRPQRRRLRRHDQRPLRHAGPAPPGHGAGRRPGPAQPGRARPVAAGGGRRPPPLGGRAGAPLRPLPRRRRAGRRDRPGGGVRPVARRPVAAAVRVPRRTGCVSARWSTCATSWTTAPGTATASGPDRTRTSRCGPGRGGRSTTSWRSSSSSASPATSSSCGTSCGSARSRTSSARAGGARPTRPSATPSASPPPTPCRSACCSSASCRRSATGRRTSTSTSRATAGRRSSSTCTRKHGRHHTAQVANVITYRARSAVRDMAKALGHAPGQQDAWAKRVDGWGTWRVDGETSPSTASRQPCSTWRRRSRTRRGTSGSTPAGWSSATGR